MSEGGFDQLIEAFSIFKKYANPAYPTHCEHDQLTVAVRPDDVADADKARPKELGFIDDEADGCFYSYRFGSC